MTEEYKIQNSSLKIGAAGVFRKVKCFYRGNGVIDVGSSIGTFIECCLENFSNSRILAFEPVKKYYDYSAEKFKNIKNVTIENLGLSDKEEEIEIYTAINNIGWNTMIKEMTDSDNASRKEVVKCICFDSYYERHRIGKIDIVKIDTEGFEYRAINGMRKFLREQKPVIVCEIGWGCNHPYWKEELEAFDYLYSVGYSKDQDDYIRKLTSTTDVVFIPTVR